jgi:hypothetical protein
MAIPLKWIRVVACLHAIRIIAVVAGCEQGDAWSSLECGAKLLF